MVVTDLVQIKRLGEQKREENERFRRYLKTHNFVEKQLKRLASEVEEQIDCTTCGNCCKVATTTLAPRDVERMARFLRLKPARFLEEYTTHSPEEGLILKRTDEKGCVFLDGTICSIYEARPGTCESFPHLVHGRGSIAFRMWSVIDNATYCPIVFNSIEAWKRHLTFSATAR